MSSERQVIKVLIVDDIPDTRENIRKLLAFEPDIEVVGGDGASTGREAVDLATQHKPDVVLMDINMPDMDGITATKAISTAVRTAAVVIMSVQNESGYLRQAMLAGARDFLTKPVSSEELYATIRRVYDRNEPIRQQEIQMSSLRTAAGREAKRGVQTPTVGAGHIIVVYSPQAGAGVTTLATNMAAALMRQDTSVLLVDANLQFGDVDAFLNLQSTSSIADLTKAVSDIDQEMIDSVLVTHGSGLKVLVAPPHPEMAYDMTSDAVAEVVKLLAKSYDFIVVDTPTQYDDTTLKLFDIAERIILVANPTIPSVRNIRKILDILDGLKEPAGLGDKVLFVLNRVVPERERGRGVVPTASIETHLKHSVVASIPLDDQAVLTAVNQGVPLVAKMKSRSPGKELVDLAALVRKSVEQEKTAEEGSQMGEPRSKSGIRALFGGA
ncbi:MAG: response regulator [Chloroflexota bacterium]|jgi:pilus assembly protein CpaE